MTPEEVLTLWQQGKPESQTAYFGAMRAIVFWDNGKAYVIASTINNDDKFPPAGPFESLEHLELAMAMRGLPLTPPLKEREP